MDTNFILTKIFSEQLDFDKALLLAQQSGFAESNPKLDVGGFDAANKLSILLAHSFGIVANTESFIFNGIENISLQDAIVAKGKGWKIKLVANARKLKNGKLATFVLPQFVKESDDLFSVENEFNAVVTESSFADKHFFKGRGAGAFPTASAVLSDISALRYDYKYEYKKLYQQPAKLTNNFSLNALISFEDENLLPSYIKQYGEKIETDAGHEFIKVKIPFHKIQETDWWKNNLISFILLPDAIEENKNQKAVKSELEYSV